MQDDEDIEGMEQQVQVEPEDQEEDDQPDEGDEMEMPEGIDEHDADNMQYDDEDDEENMLEIDENQLRDLIIQFEQEQRGIPTEPILNENGEPIKLNQEEYEAALRHFQQLQMQEEEYDQEDEQ